MVRIAVIAFIGYGGTTPKSASSTSSSIGIEFRTGPVAELNRLITANFRPSLQSRETAEFVLLPPLLVQEVISPDTVLSYPDE